MFFVFLSLCFAMASASPARIVNGVDAKQGDHGHQILLKYRGYFTCGGSILNKDWILTAAHCTESDRHPDRYTVVINEHNRRITDANEEEIGVKEVINHPHYNDNSYDGFLPNDISLLRLSTSISVPFTAIALPTKQDEMESTCNITGWGSLDSSHVSPDILQETTGETLTSAECSALWFGDVIPQTQICIHNEESGVCNGDSGGPMSCPRVGDGTPMLAGVTSWGETNCDPKLPSGYTRVSEFTEWIKEVTNIA